MEPKQRKARPAIWIAAFFIVVVAGCKAGPDYRPPDPPDYMTESFQAPSFSDPEMLDGRKQPMTAWWRQFGDETLSRLIEKLADSNLPLAEARQRIIEARARRGIVNADRIPQLDLTAGYTRAGAGEEAVTSQGPRPGEEADLYAAGVVAGWELDLWGRVSSLVKAADAEIAAGYAGYHDMKVSLAAELTLAYIDARTLQARLEKARRNIALQEKTLELAETRLHAGTGTQLQVAQTSRLLRSTRARIPDLMRGVIVAENRIKVLLGLPPREEILTPGPLPSVPALIGIGLPLDLLVRRPDIRLAGHRHQAAVARIAAAEADKYLRLSLSGVLTLQTDTAGGLLDKDSLVYSLGPSLHFPLFDGSRIRSNIEVRKSQAEQARLALEQKILEALFEVENAATGVVQSQKQVIDLAAAEEAAEQSVRLADNLYRAGLVDFFQVIDAEQQVVSIQESLLSAQQSALSEVVRLYRALGGGWEAHETGKEDGASAS